MRRTHILWAAVVVVLVAAAAGAGAVQRARMDTRLMRGFADANPSDPALVRYAAKRAAPAYKAHCAACHGADMTGDRARGAPNLVDSEWLFGDGRVSQIEQTVLHGIRAADRKTRDLADMPAFSRAKPYRRYEVPTLTRAEIDSVIDYLQSLQGQAIPADRVEAGKALYRNKAQCFDCHEMDVKGDPFIGAPNLIDKVWLYGDGGREAMRKSISWGRAGVCPAWMDKLPPAVIRALAVFIHSRAAPVAEGSAPP